MLSMLRLLTSLDVAHKMWIICIANGKRHTHTHISTYIIIQWDSRTKQNDQNPNSIIVMFYSSHTDNNGRWYVPMMVVVVAVTIQLLSLIIKNIFAEEFFFIFFISYFFSVPFRPKEWGNNCALHLFYVLIRLVEFVLFFLQYLHKINKLNKIIVLWLWVKRQEQVTGYFHIDA